MSEKAGSVCSSKMAPNFPLAVTPHHERTRRTHDAGSRLHNVLCWYDANLHWLRQHRHPVKWAANMWCGIFQVGTLGHYFIGWTLTGNKYTEGVLKGVVSDFALELPLSASKWMWFEHDEAKWLSFSRKNRNFLTQKLISVPVHRKKCTADVTKQMLAVEHMIIFSYGMAGTQRKNKSISLRLRSTSQYSMPPCKSWPGWLQS